MLTKVASYTNAIEAHLARLRLEQEGVPAFVFNEHHVWAQWDISQALGGVGVYVHAEHLAQAQAAIAAHDAGAFALAPNASDTSPACPACGHGEIEHKRVSWKAAMLTAHFAAFPLYFRPATLRCRHCGHEWDLPLTRRYSLAAIAVAAIVAALALAAITVVAMCQPHDYPSIFPQTNGCFLK